MTHCPQAGSEYNNKTQDMVIASKNIFVTFENLYAYVSLGLVETLQHGYFNVTTRTRWGGQRSTPKLDKAQGPISG